MSFNNLRAMRAAAADDYVAIVVLSAVKYGLIEQPRRIISNRISDKVLSGRFHSA